MFLAHAPTSAQIRAFTATQQHTPLTYTEVGWTRDGRAPAGYTVDHHRAVLGRGEACFQSAADVLRHWAMFRTAWITLCTPDRPFAAGETLVLHVRHLGFHSVIANRVVYTIEEPARVAFGYGTLTGHAEQGEERFQVVMDDAGTVSFELFAFSRPRHPLARLGMPIVRVLQQQAAAAYSGAMQRAVTDWAGAPGVR